MKLSSRCVLSLLCFVALTGTGTLGLRPLWASPAHNRGEETPGRRSKSSPAKKRHHGPMLEQQHKETGSRRNNNNNKRSANHRRSSIQPQFETKSSPTQPEGNEINRTAPSPTWLLSALRAASSCEPTALPLIVQVAVLSLLCTPNDDESFVVGWMLHRFMTGDLRGEVCDLVTSWITADQSVFKWVVDGCFVFLKILGLRTLLKGCFVRSDQSQGFFPAHTDFLLDADDCAMMVAQEMDF